MHEKIKKFCQAVIIILLPVFICSCASESKKQNKELMDQYFNLMSQNGLHFVDFQADEINGKINKITIDFDLKKILNVDNSRSAIIFATENLLNTINSNGDRNHYIDFPITLKNLAITIYGLSPRNENEEFVGVVCANKNEVIYFKHKLNADPFRMTVYIEKIEEALKIANNDPTHFLEKCTEKNLRETSCVSSSEQHKGSLSFRFFSFTYSI